MNSNPFSREHRMANIAGRLFATLSLLMPLVSCSSSPPAPLPTVQAVTPTIDVAVTDGTPSPATTPTADGITLSWWTPEFVSPQAAQPGGPLMESYLAGFTAAHENDIRVTPVLKARYGKGGVLDFLRTAQPVAPGILPDIVSLDVGELEHVAALGLLQPLDELLPAETLQALYPFARQAGRFGDQTLAVQYVADMEHLAYLRSRVEVVPPNWAELLQSNIPYLFPVASPQPLSSVGPVDSVQPVFISQYLSAGGVQESGTRQLLLQDEPLLRVLTFYSEALAAGLLPAESSEINDLSDVWKAYVRGQTPMAHVSARRYLAEYGSLQNVGFAAAPGWTGPAAPMTTGWALAIVTPDPKRQQAAAEFVAWLLHPEHAGPWPQATGWLPTSSQALATWEVDPYHVFLDEQLALALSPPVGPDHTQITTRMQQTLMSVLREGTPPSEAVQKAISP